MYIQIAQDDLLMETNGSKIATALFCEQTKILIEHDFKKVVADTRLNVLELEFIGDHDILAAKETMTTTMMMIF